MEIKELFEISSVIIASIGGGGFMIFSLSNWLGKIWADRLMEKEKAAYAKELESLRNSLTQEIESYKIRLKKSEFIFQKEYEATSEFIALINSFLPRSSSPDMDSYVVCDYIARRFENIEEGLLDFVSKHGAVLKREVDNLITTAINIAGDNKFITDFDVPSSANNAADELFRHLKDAEEVLLHQLHSQSSL